MRRIVAPCAVAGCEEKYYGSGLCRFHYDRKRRGRPLDTARRKKAPDGLNWQQKMDFYGWTVASNGCWLWGGNLDKRGYATMMDGRKNWRVSRLAVKRWHGALDETLFVLHTCDNPPCINPEHLYQGTQDDNARDMAMRRRGNTVRLTAEQVIECRGRAAVGERISALAREFGVGASTMAAAVSGKTWKWL